MLVGHKVIPKLMVARARHIRDPRSDWLYLVEEIIKENIL
jgi:hypothetical protein